MTIKYSPAIATEIIQQYSAAPELLVQILHAFVARFSYISDAAIRQIALELNVSRADVHGVVSFYHDFHDEPRGQTTIHVCRGEACQAMGSRRLEDHVKDRLGVDFGATTADGRFSLEPVYCLGNCACSPSVRIGDDVFARVDPDHFDELLGVD